MGGKGIRIYKYIYIYIYIYKSFALIGSFSMFLSLFFSWVPQICSNFFFYYLYIFFMSYHIAFVFHFVKKLFF